MPVRIAIAIPNYREHVPGRFLDSMVRLSVHLARRFGPGEIDYIRVGFTYIDIARNLAWNSAKRNGAETLLCIDDDMTFTPQTFETLWNTPGDVVSALYFIRRVPPTQPCAYRRMANGFHEPIDEYPPNAPFDVDAVGLGFALIRKPVLDALESPFGKEPQKGEDISFCEKVRAAGLRIVLHTGAPAGHLMNLPVEITEANARQSLDNLFRPAGAPRG